MGGKCFMSLVKKKEEKKILDGKQQTIKGGL